MQALERSGVRSLLESVREEVRTDVGGAVATYIPELTEANPELFGLALCALDGEVVEAGDSDVPFTLQSLSKPFTYGLALERFGSDFVHARVGVEPTGDAFDAIVRLDESRRRPHNPMVNAGAIAITGMFAVRDSHETSRPLLARLGAFAGSKALEVNMPVYSSELATAHRNRAIAHLLRYFGVLEHPVDDTLDLYFRQCAASITTRQLAIMAATLAAGGINPITGERVLSVDACGTVLAVLSTCGLYDASGRFLVDIGLPGKSGVSGGLLAVAPGRFGLATYSPRLDRDGNSVRGVRAMRLLSERLSLHALDVRSPGSAVQRPGVSRAGLERAHQAALSVSGGRVADYASALARADPALLGLAVCTADGREFAVGAADQAFTMQAVANPLAFALAAREVGSASIFARCGAEPSGNPFHTILLDPRTNRPYNPLGNAGALVVAALAAGKDGSARREALLHFLGEMAGDTALALDESMLAAEHAAGERNLAIASLLCWAGLIEDRQAAFELYLQQCCVRIDAIRLARIGATLANGGVQPLTGRRVLRPENVRETLSLMYACGHHDQSGSVAVQVGLPAKSGISGAILAAAPGRMGIAAWSPAVNAHGTSVRGLAALAALSRDLGLSTFHPQRQG